MNIDNAIIGLDDLKAKLAQMPAKAERRILRAAWRQTANLLRDAVRARAPVDTGKLKAKVAVVNKRSSSGKIRFNVEAGATRASRKFPGGYPYALALEAGHAFPGKGKNTHKKRLIIESEFGTSQVPPHPFMRPAFEDVKGVLLDKFGTEIAKGIEKIAGEER